MPIDDLSRAESRGSRPKVLVLSPVHPCPPDRGSKLRIYHSVRRLQARYDVTGLTFEDPVHSNHQARNGDSVSEVMITGGTPRGVPLTLLRSILGGSTYRAAKFDGSAFRRRLRERVREERYDLVWVHFLDMLQFLRDDTVQRELADATVVVDQHNDMELFWSSLCDNGGFLQRFYARWNMNRIRSFRDRVVPLCDLLLSVSEEDAEATRSWVDSDTPVWMVPNGIDPDRFDRPRDGSEGSTRMLCVGSMDMWMNQDAVTWFTREILPVIRQRRPEVEFWIVGRDPSREVRELEKVDGVTVTGYVEDLEPHYRRADLFVAPFRMGGGTKIKVLEAMAAGVPVVSTSVGARGLDVRDGEHLRIENGSVGFAEAALDLLDSEDRRRTLATSARERVEKRYSWARLYDEALDRLEEDFPRVGPGTVESKVAVGS